jgi:hypothetical protein
LREDSSLQNLPDNIDLDTAISAAIEYLDSASVPLNSTQVGKAYIVCRLGVLSKAIAVPSLAEDMIILYLTHLGRWPADLFDHVMDRLEAEWKWPRFPRLGEMRDLIAEELTDRQTDRDTLYRMRDTLNHRKVAPRPVRQRYGQWNKPIALMTAEEKAAFLGNHQSHTEEHADG